MIVAGIASNRPELCKKAVAAWRERKEFDEIWVMWDGIIAPIMELRDATHVFWHDCPEVRCIPTGSGCCRSRLVLEAWKNPDVQWLVHLDDDVMPHQGSWREWLSQPVYHAGRWKEAIPLSGLKTRGFPYGIRRQKDVPKIIHGIWANVPDLDALSQLNLGLTYAHNWNQQSRIIPFGHYFPMSSMAVAIHRDLFPASYFLWMGKDLPLNKFGDIWCGVILKRICDHFGWLVTSGAPVVYHERASNVWENLRQECKCIEENEHWWRWVDAVDLRLCATVAQCYRQIATQMEMPKEPRFEELREKMLEWISELEE